MPLDRHTSDKLKTLKKICDYSNLPCNIAELRKYEEWHAANNNNLPWRHRWFNMRLYVRTQLNPTYSFDTVVEHENHIELLTGVKYACKCKMCVDNYIPNGFNISINNIIKDKDVLNTINELSNKDKQSLANYLNKTIKC
jgi:hypothetical protein